MFRSATLSLLVLGLALPVSSGCSSFRGNLLRRDRVAQQTPERPEQPDPSEVVRQVALEHDRRAGLVRSLKVSDLNIRIDTYHDESGRERSRFLGGTAGGHLVIERPKNLRILLRKPGMSVADIGSNDRTFWFANDLSNEMVVGQYAQTEGFSDPFLASVRPDWIFEILGLEPLSPNPQIKPGESGETLLLVEKRSLGNGVGMVKESVLNITERRIVEHRLFSENGKDLIALARIGTTRAVPVGKGSAGVPPETIELPTEVQLTIPKVAMLTMYLRGVQPNPDFDFVAATTFEQPAKDGYAVVDILQLAGAQGMALADAGQERSTADPALEPGTGEGIPGSVVLPPRSDQDVTLAENSSTETSPRSRVADRSSNPGRPIPLDLPSPSQAAPRSELRRSTWDSIEGNRFRRGVLGRE